MIKKTILTLMLFSQLAMGLEFIKNDSPYIPLFRGHASFGDLNGDGLKDIFVSEIKYHYCIQPPFPPFNDCSEDIFDDVAKIFIADEKGKFSELIQEIEIEETLMSPVVLSGTQNFIKSYKSTIADMDNDGHNDIVTSDGRILINNGNAQFASATYPGFGQNLESIFTVDFNNDGVLEVVSNKKIWKRTSLLPLTYERNDSFNIDTNFKINFADFNNDNFMDIISYGSNSMRIYLNDRNGNFNVLPYYDLNKKEPLNLLVSDINGDAMVDIVLSNKRVLINQGNLQFTEVIDAVNLENAINLDQNSVDSYLPIKLIKYNNDEFPDMVIRLDGEYYYILINDGNGHFNISNNYFSSMISKTVPLFFDFNNDGYEDFVSTYNRNVYDTGQESGISIFNPIVKGISGLYINSPQDGFMSPSIVTSASFKLFMPFDIENDGTNEYLSIKNSMQGSSICDYQSRLLSMELCTESKPFYLYNLSLQDYQASEINFFDDQMRLFKGNSIGDINSDGYDDLIVSYFDCEEFCDIEKNRVFYNSESGLNIDNVQEFNVLAEGIVTDINSDGIKEIVDFNRVNPPFSASSLQITELNINGNFNVYEFDLGNTNGHFNIHDLNNDGKPDFIYIDINQKVMVRFGEGNIEVLPEPIGIAPKSARSYDLYDFDEDGDLDLYIVYDNAFYRYENNGKGVFTSETRSSIDTSLVGMVNSSPVEIHIQDFDGDGVVEIVLSKYYGLAVFQLDNNGYDQIFSYYFDYPRSETIFNKNSMIFDDFDNDGMQDILFADQIILSRDFNFDPGLNYDPMHNGHGFSIENVAEDQFFTVFYTYDQQGKSEWYSDLGIFQNPKDDYWVIGDHTSQSIRALYDYDAQSFYLDNDSDYQGSIKHDSCSESFGQLNISYEIGLNSFGGPLERGDWCSQPLVGYYNRPKTDDMSGLWWAGNEDAGWGWSVELFENGDQIDMVVILYYFDGSGQPRWLIGQQSGFEAGQEMTLDMNMVQGYGRSASPNNLAQIPAGTMSLTLNQASSNILSAGTMSIDVSYPGDEGGHWVRDNIPIALFSTAR